MVFDWAWTLADLADEDGRRPFQRMFEFLREKGVSVPDWESAYELCDTVFRGMIAESRKNHREAGFDQVLHHLLLQFSIDIAGKTTEREILEAYYEEVYAPRRLYPDAMPTIQGLKAAGMPMGIISNTTNPGFMKRREQQLCGLDGYFEFSIFSSEMPYRKPHPSIFRAAAGRLGLEPGEILYVGDQLVNDVAGAQNAGMQAAWINRKGQRRGDNDKPDFEFKSLTEILDIVSVKV